MTKASFKNPTDAEKHGLTTDDCGDIVAQETRDGIEYLTVLFDGVEVNGVPSVVFLCADENGQNS